MPYSSKSQMRFMFAAEARKEVPDGTARRWAHHTKNLRKLPEKVALALRPQPVQPQPVQPLPAPQQEQAAQNTTSGWNTNLSSWLPPLNLPAPAAQPSPAALATPQATSGPSLRPKAALAALGDVAAKESFGRSDSPHGHPISRILPRLPEKVAMGLIAPTTQGAVQEQNQLQGAAQQALQPIQSADPLLQPKPHVPLAPRPQGVGAIPPQMRRGGMFPQPPGMGPGMLSQLRSITG